MPVIINWQADDNEYIVYKARLTDAKLMVYDDGFAGRLEELRDGLPFVQFFETSKVEG